MLEKTVSLLVLAALPLAAQQGPEPLTLAAAVRRAAGEAAPVELAGLRVEEAGALVRQSRAGLLPSLSAGAGWLNRTFNRRSLGFDFPTAPGTPAPPDLIGPFDNVDARLRFAQPLLDWSSVLRVRAARARVAGADADRELAAEAAAQAAALAYLRAARADVVLGARREDLLLARELVDLAEAQLEAGVGTTLDVTRARTQWVEAREGVVVAESRAARARIELARAMGLAAGTPVAVAESLGPATAAAGLPVERGAALAQANRERPDLRAEAARADAARRGAAAIAAERLPRIDVTADYGVNGPTAAAAIGTRQVAVQVTLPILDGFRREGRLDEQRAAARASEVRRGDLEMQVAADVDVALLDLRVAEAQQAIAVERRALAVQELAQARDRLSIGTAGNLELINAQLSLLRARDADIDARFAAAVARVALARAVGGARSIR